MTGAAPRAGSDPGSLPRVRVAPVVVVAYVLAALLVLGVRPPGHATRSPESLTWTAVAAVAVLLGGVATLLVRRYRRQALLSLAAVGIWLASNLVGWPGGPGWLRAAALAATPFAVPASLHLILVSAQGPLRARAVRLTAGAAYGVTALVTLATLVSRDPLLDPYCWQDCNLRALALAADREVARLAVRSGLVLTVVLAVIGAAVASRGVGGPDRSGRVPRSLVTVPAAVLLAGYAVQGLAGLRHPALGPDGGWFRAAYGVQVAGVLLLGSGLVVLAVREHRRRLALRRLAGRLGEVPPVGSLESHLASVLDDPTVQVAYWLPEQQRFVDSSGRTVTPERSGSRRGAELRRDQELLAVLTLERADVDDDELSTQLGSATRLALDNERLQAGISAQLDELRSSRARVVDAADRARRQLERDLHDGAQADLVGLLLEAGRRRSAALRDGDAATAAALGEVVEQVSGAVAGLRELTHGIYPAELDEVGLEAALWTLTDDAPVPVTLRVDLTGRPPTAVARAAYLVAAEAVGRAEGGGPLRLDVRQDGMVLVLRAAPVPTGVPLRLVDRVGALGGDVQHRDDGWEVRLPCGSS